MFPRTLATIGLIAAAATTPSLAAAPRYTIELLGDLPGGQLYSQGIAINNHGLAGGQSVSDSGWFASQWAADGSAQRSPVSLGDLPGGSVSSKVYGLNDAGTSTRVSSVDSSRPPITTTAIGARLARADSEVEAAEAVVEELRAAFAWPLCGVVKVTPDGEVVSLADFGFTDAESKAFEASLLLDEGHFEKAEGLAYQAMLTAAKTLVQLQVQDVPNTPDVFARDMQTGVTRQYHNMVGTVGGGADRSSFPAN